MTLQMTTSVTTQFQRWNLNENTSWKLLKHSFEKICSHSDYQLIGSAIFDFTYKTVMHANHQHIAMVNAHKGVLACFLKIPFDVLFLMWNVWCTGELLKYLQSEELLMIASQGESLKQIGLCVVLFPEVHYKCFCFSGIQG